MIQSALLSRIEGLSHGFGTRTSALTQQGMASLKQIHSNVTLEAQPGCVGEGDALVTNQHGLAVSIRTADCYPVLLADPQRGAVAAIHAGWRGTESRIVVEAIARMRSLYGTGPETLVAAVGPGIGVCCYEVGLDVARRFGMESPGRLDLSAAIRRQLLESGVREERIEILGACTYCDAERFHSYRREGQQAGRMISFIRHHR